MGYITNFLLESFSSYALTFLIASSSLFEPFRLFIVNKFPKLRIGVNKHPIYCRMCIGFWTSLVCTLVLGNYADTLAVWGLSYFLATQEK